MQPTDPNRHAVEIVADLLARAGAGAPRPTDDAARSLHALIAERLRATAPGAQAVAQLEQTPTSEPARQAAAAALAEAGGSDPGLAARVSQAVSQIQWMSQPPAPTPAAPPPFAQPANPYPPPPGPYPQPPAQPGYGPPSGPYAPGPYPPPPAAGGRRRGGLIAAIVVGVLVLCLGGITAVGLAVWRLGGEADPSGGDPAEPPVAAPEAPGQEEAAAIDGIINYHESRPDLLSRDHSNGSIEYEITPPPGGLHNDAWQNCQGTVYDAPIADEHAVHSLEHGAVWITYRPDLPADQVERLAERVRGSDYLLLSPYPGLDAPISLQAWGYQLKVDSAEDARIDEFIRALRITAAPEFGAPCGGGVTSTGTTPVEDPDA